MSNIIISKDEISEEIIVDRISKRINFLDKSIKEEDKEKIITHGLAQISNVLDKLSKEDSVLDDMRCITIPEYSTSPEGTIEIKDPLLKKSNIKNNKQGIIDFIYDLCDTSANYGVRGVQKYYDYEQKYRR